MATLQSKIESLLFISNQPFALKKIADITKAEKEKVSAAVDELMTKYNQQDSGITISRIGDKVQMVTSGDNSKMIAEYIKEETTGELTRAALETLTIVAYRGPITRAELEQIRGVNCAVILRNLQIRGLVESVDDKKKMQSVYSVTLDFLKFLGINQTTELPEYERLNSSQALEKILQANNQPAA